VAAAVAAAVAGSVLLRRRPLLAIGLLAAASVAFGLARNSPTISLAHYVAVDVALGFIVATRNRPTRIAALALTLAVIPGYARARMAFAVPAAGPPGWEVYVLTAVVAWLAGDSVRRARNYAGRLRAHAVAEAVTAERLRISRELHDLVAHSMGIITLQAGAAARVIDTQPQRVREALFEVENAGRGAAGVHVDVRWQGERRPLPPDVELAAYRIIQESVTNVVRHAGTRSCQVLIADDGEAVSVEVADHGQGPGDGPSGTGCGLAGMRERAVLLNGDFSAGPGPDGGFVVRARLPLPAKAMSA
jgi:signal transduction histidine kinase